TQTVRTFTVCLRYCHQRFFRSTDDHWQDKDT
ncbi:hypothetical protein VCHENC02_3277B, partial [Vibrio harveyi]